MKRLARPTRLTERPGDLTLAIYADDNEIYLDSRTEATGLREPYGLGYLRSPENTGEITIMAINGLKVKITRCYSP